MDAKQFVVERLRAEDRPSLNEIARSAGVGESWLRMFARGEIPDPSYSRIKKLSDYFMRAP